MSLRWFLGIFVFTGSIWLPFVCFILGFFYVVFLDKNECDEEEKCEAGKYCVNNPGSYRCEGK